MAIWAYVLPEGAFGFSGLRLIQIGCVCLLFILKAYN